MKYWREKLARLRALYQQQQQQQQQQPSSSHRRTKSRDLDSQFANLSLKQKDSSSGCDPISGPLHWLYDVGVRYVPCLAMRRKTCSFHWPGLSYRLFKSWFALSSRFACFTFCLLFLLHFLLYLPVSFFFFFCAHLVVVPRTCVLGSDSPEVVTRNLIDTHLLFSFFPLDEFNCSMVKSNWREQMFGGFTSNVFCEELLYNDLNL